MFLPQTFDEQIDRYIADIVEDESEDTLGEKRITSVFP